jgi:hypothetical protein
MRWTWILTVGAGGALACASAIAACGNGNSNTFGPGDGTDSGLDDGGNPNFKADGSGGEGGGGCVKCSADLHDILDCNTNALLQACPPGTGCGPSGCEAPCDSARDNKSSVGCDYYSVDPGTDSEANGSCFAAYIANTWDTAATLNVTYAGKSLNVGALARIPKGAGNSITYSPLPGGVLPPGEMAILFLADFPMSVPLPTRCPAGVTAGYTASEASSQDTAIIHSFHITSNVPVVAYDIFPYGGAKSYITSATLLIPSSAWDTNYIAVDCPESYGVGGVGNQAPFIELAAATNGTHITLSPTADIVGGTGIAAGLKGKLITYTLNDGDVIQLKQNDELIGTPIQSDHPIGVWGGHSCTTLKSGDGACDSAHQELVPVRALGFQYAAVRHKNRTSIEEVPPWRIVGAVDGTTLTYTPAIATAPKTIKKGELQTFDAAGPFVVSSQDKDHPFYLGSHMTGEFSQGGQNFGTGDPEWVNVIPPQQYLAKYIFFTDPTMSFTNIVLVRDKATDGSYKDVTLDCAGVVGSWLPIAGTTFQYTRVDLQANLAPVGKCDNGLHEVHSDAPFGLTVWGWDITVSYGYPAGASVQPINSVVVVPTPN